MKKYLTMSLLALLTLNSCLVRPFNSTTNNDTPTQVHEPGQVTTMDTFGTVNVIGPFNVIYENGEGYTVRVDGTAEQMEKMTIYVEKEELCIDVTDYKWPRDKNLFNGMRIFVSSPIAKELNITGSGSLTAPKAIAAEDLKMKIAGSGDITISQMKCGDMDIKIAGSGDVTTGPIQANNVTAVIAGSGDMDITGLTCKNLNNRIAGSGDITFKNLNAAYVKTSIAGSGDVILNGQAGKQEQSIAGSGSVDISGLKITGTAN